MIEQSLFTLYNLILGLVTGVGVLYFLFLRRTNVEYHRFLFVTVSGLLLFLLGGPVTELIAPELVHWVHSLASLLVILGLYDPLKNDLRNDAWADALLGEASHVRDSADWMLPIDDAILSIFHTTELVLTPSIIAYNIDYSRSEVNRRLAELETRGFVTKVERGKYRITALGRGYLDGAVSHRLRSQVRHLWRMASNK